VASSGTIDCTLIEDHQIVENSHHGHDDADCPLFVDGHAGGAVAVIDPQDATLLLRERRIGGDQRHAQHAH
jgi:hypothetical protein